MSDQTIHADYDRMKAELGDHEYLTEHILVAKEGDAQKIIDQLKKGASFEKLAKENSIDPGSKANGGKLDWAAPATYDKNFADAMVKLKKGETSSTPVKSPFGYHVIRVLDIRPPEGPSLRRNEGSPGSGTGTTGFRRVYPAIAQQSQGRRRVIRARPTGRAVL